VLFSFLKPALEAFDMGLYISTKLLERTDLPVCISKMLAQNGKDFLFWSYATRVSKIEVNDIMYLIQAESELL
jgi:hypothetical protein